MVKTELHNTPLQFDLFPLTTAEIEPDTPLLLQPESSSTIPKITTKRRSSPLGEGEKRTIVLSDSSLEYTLLRSSRRTIGLLIDQHGLRITAPKRSSLKTIEDVIREKQRWIKNKFRYQYERIKEVPQPIEWEDGTHIPYLGSKIVLRLRRNHSEFILLNEHTSELILYLVKPKTPTQISECVKKWLQKQAREIFSAKLATYAKNLNVNYRSVSLSSAKQRWGSCTASGAIRINWKLIHFPCSLINYVVIHELAHLREMNHSQRFWDIVASIYPNYTEARKELHVQSSKILSIL